MASSKAARSSNPEAYPKRYVEGFERRRTMLGGIFISLLEKEVALRHRKHRRRFASQPHAISRHDIGFRIDLDLGQVIIQFEIPLLHGATILYRGHSFLQTEHLGNLSIQPCL